MSDGDFTLHGKNVSRDPRPSRQSAAEMLFDYVRGGSCEHLEPYQDGDRVKTRVCRPCAIAAIERALTRAEMQGSASRARLNRLAAETRKLEAELFPSEEIRCAWCSSILSREGRIAVEDAAGPTSSVEAMFDRAQVRIERGIQAGAPADAQADVRSESQGLRPSPALVHDPALEAARSLFHAGRCPHSEPGTAFRKPDCEQCIADLIRTQRAEAVDERDREWYAWMTHAAYPWRQDAKAVGSPSATKGGDASDPGSSGSIPGRSVTEGSPSGLLPPHEGVGVRETTRSGGEPSAEPARRDWLKHLRDWHEDFEHENGRYQCRCIVCGEMFDGHKRRNVCRHCAAKAPVEPAAEWVEKAKRWITNYRGGDGDPFANLATEFAIIAAEARREALREPNAFRIALEAIARYSPYDGTAQSMQYHAAHALAKVDSPERICQVCDKLLRVDWKRCWNCDHERDPAEPSGGRDAG